MNKIWIYYCVVVFMSYSYARPDVSLGYRYNQGHSAGGDAILHAPIVTSYAPTAVSNSYFSSQPTVGQIGSSGFLSSAQSNKNVNFGSGFSGDVSSFGNSYSNTGTGFGSSSHLGFGSVLETQADVRQNYITPIVSKHFYVHTAPSDEDEEEIVRHIQVGQPQKNYHVVFINTPSLHRTKAKIIADIAPVEEKTAVYVLAKKNNALDISTEINNPTPVNNKPEVFFVKYKTPEEAYRAQHAIKAQYDALGGTSDIANEGQIPVSSAIGTLQTASAGGDIFTSASTNDGSLSNVEIQHTGINTQQTYLPSNPTFLYKY